MVLADEVGMGKTFVALAIAYSIAARNPRGPVIVMAPANLIGKWKQDLATFCELYLQNRRLVRREGARHEELTAPEAVRYGTARHSVDLMRLLDDPDPSSLPSHPAGSGRHVPQPDGQVGAAGADLRGTAGSMAADVRRGSSR